MKLYLTIALMVLGLVSARATCTPRLTEPQAIRLAQQRLVHTRGKRVLVGLHFNARLEDCVWRVAAETPPTDWGGPFLFDVNAQTGHAEYIGRMRTDPEKIRLSEKRR